MEALLGPPAFRVANKGLRFGNGGSGSDATGIFQRNNESMALMVKAVVMEANETAKGIQMVLAKLVEELGGSVWM